MSGVSAFTYKSDIEKLKIHKANKSIQYPHLIFVQNIIMKTLLIIKNRWLKI